MIMNRGYENTRRGRGALAVVAVCGWACFVLTGASAPAAAAGANEEASAELRAVVKIVTDGDATPEADVLMLLGDAAVATEGAHIFMLAGPTAEEGSSGRFVQTWVSRPGEAQLAAFAERFPAADLDGDGKVSVQERDAFLAAMALAAPQQVLERFPHADRNGDGVLDADEAARLVTGALAPAEGMPTIEAIRLSKEHGESHPAGAHLLLEADSDPETAGDSVKMKVTLREDGDGTQRKEVVVRARPLGSDDARVEKSMEWIDKDGIRRQAQVRSMGPHPQIAPLVLAAQWIPENVAAAPTRDEAAALLAMVERAPLDFFLELNPAADLDGDGVLTAQERDEYLAKQMAEMRARLLERHPEADADGDGVLTQEEMKAYFARRRGMDGVFEMLDDEGGVRILKLRRNGAEASGSIRIEMEVVKPDEEE